MQLSIELWPYMELQMHLHITAEDITWHILTITVMSLSHISKVNVKTPTDNIRWKTLQYDYHDRKHFSPAMLWINPETVKILFLQMARTHKLKTAVMTVKVNNATATPYIKIHAFQKWGKLSSGISNPPPSINEAQLSTNLNPGWWSFVQRLYIPTDGTYVFLLWLNFGDGSVVSGPISQYGEISPATTLKVATRVASVHSMDRAVTIT